MRNKKTPLEKFAESIDSFILTTPQGIRDYSKKLKECLELEGDVIKSAYIMGMIEAEKSNQGDDFEHTKEKVNEYYQKAEHQSSHYEGALYP